VRTPALHPQHWHERARQARAVAEWIRDPVAKRLLSEVAERYEEIATIAETGRLGFGPPQESR